MGKLTFRDYAYSDEITLIPDPVWRQMRQAMRRQIQREKKKRNITGAVPAAGWDLIMDEDRHVINPSRPSDMSVEISHEEYSQGADHVARAERMFEIYQANPIPDESLLSGIKHDIEAAVLGLAAWDDEFDDYAWRVLNLLSQPGEVDALLNYEAVLLAAFDASDNTESHPSPEALVNSFVSRLEAAAPDAADGIRSLWGSYLMVHGKLKDGEKLIKELIKKNPNDTRFYLSMAMPFVEMGDRRHAEKYLNEALELALHQGNPELVETITEHLIDLGAMSSEEADEIVDDAYDMSADVAGEESMVDNALIEEAMQDHPEYADFMTKYGPDAEMDGMSPMMHLVMHAVVERMIRSGEVPEMQMVLIKLTSQGMSRHDAMHCLAEPLAESLYDIMTGNEPFDNDAYVRKIKKLMR